MKICVIGKEGQLAKCLCDIAPQYQYFDKQELDLSIKDSIDNFFSDKHYDLIINLAAYTAVDQAEEEQNKANLINAEALKTITQHTKRLIHISTDYVFSGTHTSPLQEDDTCSPVNYYGTTKLNGEKNILNSDTNSIIIRTSWLYSEYGQNFLKTMLRLSQERSEIRVVADQYGCPTYAGDLASIIVLFAKKFDTYKSGIYHYCNKGKTTWYEFAKNIMELSDSKTEVHPINTDQYPTKAARPHYSVLNTSKIENELKITIPNWQESLKKCLQKISY